MVDNIVAHLRRDSPLSWQHRLEAADEITRLREEIAAVTERMSKLDFERTAAELERDALREENARLRAALKPFADDADCKFATYSNHYLRDAAAAIREGGKDE